MTKKLTYLMIAGVVALMPFQGVGAQQRSSDAPSNRNAEQPQDRTQRQNAPRPSQDTAGSNDMDPRDRPRPLSSHYERENLSRDRADQPRGRERR